MSIIAIARWKDQDPESQATRHEHVAGEVIPLARRLGNTHHNVYHCHERREGFVVDEWETREGMESFYGSEAFRTALAEAGFAGPDEVLVLEPLPGGPDLRY